MAGTWEQLTLPLDVVPALPGPRTLDERIAAGRGARRLLAVILRQALVDEALLVADTPFDKRQWPWDGQWTPRQELDAFWASEWFESVCEWLDLDSTNVLDLVQQIRGGTKVLSTDKRRAIARG